MTTEKITADQIRKGDVLRIVEEHGAEGARLSCVETFEGRVLTIREGAVVLTPVDDPSGPHAAAWTTSRPGCTVTVERLVDPVDRLTAAFADVWNIDAFTSSLERANHPTAANIVRAAWAVVEEARVK